MHNLNRSQQYYQQYSEDCNIQDLSAVYQFEEGFLLDQAHFFP